MNTEAALDGVFKAVSDPTRRSILGALRSESLAVQALAARFPEMSRPAISKHLRILREAGLVDEEQKGRQRYYHLIPGALSPIAEWLEALGARSAFSTPAASSPVPRTVVAPRPADDWRVW